MQEEEIPHDPCVCFAIAVDAVYAMAHAVHKMIGDVCGSHSGELCAELKPAPQGKDLLKYIRNVSFIGKQWLPVDCSTAVTHPPHPSSGSETIDSDFMSASSHQTCMNVGTRRPLQRKRYQVGFYYWLFIQILCYGHPIHSHHILDLFC